MNALTPQMQTHRFAAGPLTLGWCEGQLQYIRLGDREIVRRIYVGVRDAGWQTVPGIIHNLSFDSVADGFVVRWDSVHTAGALKFRWHGTVTGDGKGVVEFTMEGEALSEFAANRIGICVLHPVDELRGVRCRIETTQGQSTRAEFPKLIHPHLPFSNVRAMRYAYPDGVEISLAFDGDTFETEDQRQWGDASWKTYSRPSALPKPFEVRAGQRFAQSVTLAVAAGPQSAVPWRPPQMCRMTVEPSVGHELPAIGVAWNGTALTAWQRETLGRVAPAHVRVYLVPARDGLVAALQSASNEAQALGTSLNLVASLTRSPAAEIATLIEALELVRPKVQSLTVMSLVDALPSVALVRSAKKAVANCLRGVPVGLGVRPYFTELNRNRDMVADADFVSVPWSPSVHLDDDATIVENLPSLLAAAETFRSFAGSKALVLDRVSLRDARQGTLFVGGFVVGHLAIAARAGISRVTLFDPGGLADKETQAFPMFHVLCDIAEFGGTVALKTRVSQPQHVASLVLQRERSVRVLLANLQATEIAVELQLPSLGTTGFLRRLGVQQWQHAVAQPNAFRARPASAWAGSPVVLGPHEIVRLDLA